MMVTHEYFSVLGTEPVLGRSFLPKEEQEGHHTVTILSHRLWQRRFGGDSSILGETISINGAPHLVVGILPEGFQAPLVPRAELWSALPVAPPPEDREHSYVRVIGRLAPGVSLAVAQEEMNLVAKTLAEEYPKALGDVGVTLRPLLDSIVGKTRGLLWMLFGTVTLVTLAACVNVANLMLGRTAMRRREMGVRLALGAGRGRLVWQILCECLLLAVGGSLLGLFVGQVCLVLLRQGAPAQIPRLDSIQLDGAMFVYTLMVSLTVALLAGLFPALEVWRHPPSHSLNPSASTTGRRNGHRMRNLLVATQVAFGVLLLSSAGLLARTLINLSQVDLGFQTDSLVLGRLILPPQRFPEPQGITGYLEQVEERLGQHPTIAEVGVVSSLPIADGYAVYKFMLEGIEPEPDRRYAVLGRSTSPGFFGTLGLPLVSGRFLEPTDTAQSLPVVVVNETFVERFVTDRNPVGLRLRLGDPEEPLRTIVGVVGDVRGGRLHRPPSPEIYSPLTQRLAINVTLVARAARAPASALELLRDVPTQIHPDQAVADLETMDDVIARTLALPQFTSRLVGIFGVVILILIALGVFGVTLLSVTQRRREIAIRLALGARIQTVVGKVLLASGLVITCGMAVGLVLAFLTRETLSSLLYGVVAMDPMMAVAVVLLLAGVGCGATLLSALRATQIEPAKILKED